jgi:phosphoribosylamine--glycine ligase
MRVLVVGGGGREHALVWKISRNSSVEKIYAAPGNAGMTSLADCIKVNVNSNEELASFAEEKDIGLTVVGPEAPLVAGIVDIFRSRGLRIFGSTREASQIEGSKSFAKNLMKKYGIPTGDAIIFDDYNEALSFVKKETPPFVVKADGLAAGKGVVVCFDQESALKALDDCFIEKKFGSAGQRVMLEEYLEGEEVTVKAFTDGETVLPMVPVQDYKPVFDGDEGPNTGGMGSYSPVPAVDEATYQSIVNSILEPTVQALRNEGIIYQGVLYAGIILTRDGPKVLEFNCRFGDPESQAIFPLLYSDLVEIMMALIEGNLKDYRLKWSTGVCVTAVLASKGYPGSYEQGFEISGLDEAAKMEGVQVFHAGTAKKDGKIVTAGGRVLNVSAVGGDFSEARKRAYRAIEKIHFKGMHFRTDIALRAVQKIKI